MNASSQNGSALLRPPPSLARFADPVWLRTVVAPRLAPLLGDHGCDLTVEITDRRFKSYLKPASWRKTTFGIACRVRRRAAAGGTDRERHLFIKAFLDGRSREAARTADGSNGRAPLHLGELDALVWSLPAAPGLPQLVTLMDPQALRDSLPDTDKGWNMPATVLATRVINYRPEQRCTLRIETPDGGPAWYAKAYADETGVEAARRLWHLDGLARAGRIGFGVPRPCAYQPGIRTLWTEMTRGLPLALRLDGQGWHCAIQRVGRSLAELHRVGLAGRVEWDGRALIDEARHKAKKLVPFSEPGAGLMLRILDALESEYACIGDGLPVAIHGDFHVGQLIDSSSRLTICDLDEAAAGACELDIANFLVDLETRGLGPGTLAAIEATLLRAYECHAATTPSARRLAWHRVIAYVNRAYRAYLQQGLDADERVMRFLRSADRACDALAAHGRSAFIGAAP